MSGDLILEISEGVELESLYLDRVWKQIEPIEQAFSKEWRLKFELPGPKQLRFKSQDKQTPVSFINVQSDACKQLSLMTVMSRCLGKMSRWPEVLENVAALGYNAIHLTPIQTYGESFSHYSIKD